MDATTQHDGQIINRSLPRATPASLGVAAGPILEFIHAVNTHLGGLHGMMLLCHGSVVAESWWTPYRPDRRHLLWSLSKSFTSTAIGLAVAEGRLSVEDKVIGFFPDLLPDVVSENLAAMRVKHLLTMTTGHDQKPVLSADDDWVRMFLACEVKHEPGTHFLYNTFGTHTLSAILQKLTGERLVDYLTPRLFAPLGITEAHSEQSPMGIDIGGYGLSLRLESIAKFGQLYLQKGQWDGAQLIPADWVEQATRGQVSNGDPATGSDWNQGYGYQFWRCLHNCYRGDGAFGQYCVVMPEHNAVLAIHANQENMIHLEFAWKHLLPALTGGGSAALVIPPQEVPMPAGKPDSPTAQRISGKRFILEANDETIQSLTLKFDETRCLLDVVTDGRRFTIPIGLGDWLEGVHAVAGVPHAIASRGVWEDPNTFTVKICFTERPDDWSQSFVFDADAITVTRRSIRFGFIPGERPDLKGTLG